MSLSKIQESIHNEDQAKLAAKAFYLSIAFFIFSNVFYIYSSIKSEYSSNKEKLKSKLESINDKKVQKTADTIDIDGYRLVVSKVIKNNRER